MRTPINQINRLMLSALLLLLSAAAFAQETTVQGTLSSIRRDGSRETAFVRTADADLELDVSRLPAETQELLRSPDASRKIQELRVPRNAISNRTAHPTGVRSDCTELPMSLDDFEKVIASPNVQNTEDFLRQLPKGTFQTYTYVTNSLSAQRGSDPATRVTDEWPRVVRSSHDGRITFSWTCNPASETKNHVELLYYDESNELRGKSYKLDKPPETRGPNARIDDNPTSCVGCHSTGIPQYDGKRHMKHNWPEYFFWSDCNENRGIRMFGSSDDNMGPSAFRGRLPTTPGKVPQGCDSRADREFVTREKQKFQSFSQRQADNPCYNLLPKPNSSEVRREAGSYRFYPYADNAQDRGSQFQDYSLRTNARITDVYSRQNSIRIASLLKKHPDYEKMKYFLAMEANRCITPQDREIIRRLVPNMVLDRQEGGERGLIRYDPRDSQLLYDFSLHVGMQPADWSMEYRRGNQNYNDGSYNAVMFSGPGGAGDSQMHEVVGGQIIKDVATTNPRIEVATRGQFTTGVAELFGPRFSCIDDMAAETRRAAKGANSELCRALRAKNDEHIRQCFDRNCQSQITQPRDTAAQARKLEEALGNIRREMERTDTPEMRASIEKGRQLVQGGKANCVSCHASDENSPNPPALQFIPSEKSDEVGQAQATSQLRRLMPEGILDSFKTRVVDVKTMPPGMDDMLDAGERNDILNYLKNVAAGQR